jgi:acyl-CoA hydrolase
MAAAPQLETLTHRLVLPRDANHHGSLYAGVLLSFALEAAYATAYRAVGESANLVLKRVLDLRCFEPVPVGKVIEVRGCEVVRARAYVVVGLHGTPLGSHHTPWMDGLMQFVQIDSSGRPEPIDGETEEWLPPAGQPWLYLSKRASRLLAIRL